MAPYVPEEVNVFSVPHSRMKELVHNYFAMIQSTNFTDGVDLQQLLECLSRIFFEFKTHEQIENRFIMKRLKLKLKRLSIKNTAVCNCHKDNNLTEMIRLLKDGYKKKTEQDRLNYGLQLKKALEDFTRIFLPHMKEEEEVFQPLLLQHFTYEELRDLKQKVIQQHFEQELEKTGWLKQQEEKYDSTSSSDGECCYKVQHEKDCIWRHRSDIKEKFTREIEKPVSKMTISDLPPELLIKIFRYLPPNNLCQCIQVSHLWYKLATDRSLWRDVLPSQWARGDWTFQESNSDCDEEDQLPVVDEFITLDDDADIDESLDNGFSALIQRVKNEARILTGLSSHLLPRVGLCVQKLVLSRCRTLTNGLLQRFLSLCPNVEHLDLSQTKITDAGLRRLGKNGCGNKLKTINLSGCVNITDATMVRLAMALSSANSLCSKNGNTHKPGCANNDMPCSEGLSIIEGNVRDVEIVEPSSFDTECLCEKYYEICKTSLREACARSCGVPAPDPCSLNIDEKIPTYCKSCDNERTERVQPSQNQGHQDLSSGPCMCDSSEQDYDKCYDTGGCQQHGCSSCYKSQHSKEDLHDKGRPPNIYRRMPDSKNPESMVSPLDPDHTSCHTYCASTTNTGTDLHSLEDCLPDQMSNAADHLQPASLHYEQPCDTCSNAGKCCKKRGTQDDRIRYLESINLSGCYQVTDLGLRALSGSGIFPYLQLIDFSGLFRITGESLHDLVAVCPSLNASNLYYCDNIVAGPFPDSASGCRNLQCGSRVCCRSGD
ncbi:hypothetical protein LSH36_52g07052 [Paralvinella palmiformis]|uniref:F-box/LRR-repeat protein 5 n=1 Tax=Paralvinella palmiformis TaxID=53620 RepID=A0AAD9NCU2_9ANNE|nr:hypothetical protein LSH36_52g07052 [Paralvinella palmiformis]